MGELPMGPVPVCVCVCVPGGGSSSPPPKKASGWNNNERKEKAEHISFNKKPHPNSTQFSKNPFDDPL